MGDNLVIRKTALQEIAKEKGFRLSSDVYDAVNAEVLAMMDKAFKRMEGNLRKTLKPLDL